MNWNVVMIIALVAGVAILIVRELRISFLLHDAEFAVDLANTVIDIQRGIMERNVEELERSARNIYELLEECVELEMERDYWKTRALGVQEDEVERFWESIG